MKTFKGVSIGAGYFSPFQYEAWQRMPETQITAMCKSKVDKARPLMQKYDVPSRSTNQIIPIQGIPLENSWLKDGKGPSACTVTDGSPFRSLESRKQNMNIIMK